MTLAALTVVCGCQKETENQGSEKLKVISMTPTEGITGDEVTITGEGFSIVPSENVVTLNGARLTAVETSVTVLKMTVPANKAGTYPLVVTVGGKTVEGPEFTYKEGAYEEKLVVEPLEKTSGYSGDQIVIKGKGFSAEAKENSVLFGEKAGEITASSTTQLTVTVPELAPGEYRLTVKAGVQTDASLTFTCLEVPVLKVTNISPTQGHAGTEIVIEGENFSAVTSENKVMIGGKNAEVKTASATELTVIAPENELGIYKVVVTVGKQTVEGFEFEYVKPELVYTVSSDVHSGNKLMFLTGMAMLPDGRLAVSCRATHEIKVFDLQNKKQSVLVNKYADAHPWNISMNPDDKMLYIAYKAKGEIGRMDPSKGDGQNVEIVVSGHANMMDVKFDAKGNMYVLVRDERKIYKYPKGQFNNASAQVFVNLDGKGEGLYSMDFDVDGNLIIGSQRDGFYLAAPDGKVTKIVGNGGGSTDGEVGQPLTAQFVQPVATVVDKTRGDIYFADPYNQKIRRIRPGKKGYEDATVSTVAGTGVGGNSDGDGVTATLKMPYGMTMTADGSTIYFSDMDNQIIRKISVTEK